METLNGFFCTYHGTQYWIDPILTFREIPGELKLALLYLTWRAKSQHAPILLFVPFTMAGGHGFLRLDVVVQKSTNMFITRYTLGVSVGEGQCGSLKQFNWKI